MEFVKLLQQIRNPFFDFLFNLISFLGEPVVIVLILCILYWCVNKRKSEKLIFILIGSMAFNDSIKNFIRIERPWILDNTVTSLRPDTATGYSFPSGHTQFTASLYSSLMLLFKKRWIYILGTVLIILMPLSRMYLGAHTFWDIFAALIIGIGLTILFSLIYDKICDKSPVYLLIFLIPLAFVVIALLPFWNEKPPITKDSFKIIGIAFGGIIGIVTEKMKIGFSEKADFKTNLIKLIIGISGILIIQLGLKFLFSFTPEGVSEYLSIIRYFAITIWATLGMGFIIKKFFNR